MPEIICADILAWAASYQGPKFHALITDPPYHLTSITKRFGGKNAAPAQFGKDGAFSRASAGFMGKTWDGGDIAFRPETWAALGEHLYPGAFGMSFASSRGWHRLAVAIEDAGFVIHPSIFCWGFGNGFPKATRIKDDRFDGHRYGAQAIKPAIEPIIVFQKPYDGKPQQNIIETGAGALNIDGARIGVDSISAHGGRTDGWGVYGNGVGLPAVERGENEHAGRWPANLALVHSLECTPGRCVSDCPVLRLGEQSGEQGPFGSLTGNEPSTPAQTVYNGFGRHSWDAYGDSGTASRFFMNADWSSEVAEQINQADPVRYEAKASSAERERGLEDFESQMVGDGRKKSIDNAYQRGKTERKNTHPTIKPVALIEWLSKLLLPPAEYAPRRIMVPFSGSGSEMIGCHLAGWEEITGVEAQAEYVAIAQARLAYYTDPLRLMKIASTEDVPAPFVQTSFLD